MARISPSAHQSDNPVVAELLAQQHIDEVHVTVKVQYDDADGGSDDTGSDEPDADEDWYGSERSSCDEFADWKWLEQIDGLANVGHEQVADCNVKLIRRARMRRAFWVEMEEPSEETSDLAFELFDRYGCLNREYYEHGIRKGSGVWGQELDHGDILLFESLSVVPLWRHQRIGTKVVNAILDKARTKSTGFFAFAQLGCLTRDLDRACEDGKERREAAEELLTISAHFWRSLGFRRVGTSGWLAFTDDSSHPSRSLDSAQDWNRPENSKEEPLPEQIRTVMSTLSDPSASDAECVRQIQEAFPIEADAPPRLYTDEYGNTILHLAAVGRKTETVSYILAKYPMLTDMRNAEGHTPLEALQSSLEEYRTRRNHLAVTTVFSDKFEGFSQSDIACLAALTGTEIFDLSKLSNRDISAISSAADDALSISRIPRIDTIRYTLRLKYGCTCGQCIGGFLSPRMHYALLCQAEVRYDMLAEDLGETGSAWVAINGRDLRYLASSVRENLKTNKSMRRGFINMCDHIAHCLRDGRLPDEETVLDVYRNKRSEWPPVTRNYLERGGTVAAVATMLFERAMESDAWAGDGMLVENHGDEIKNLPVCRNDHEFGFVSGMCGYKRISAVRYVDLFGREL
ncbi:hypothetical protein C8A01DRAFT_21238 [Parachaetomium inaequale]|uniref:N-acetyltransferase domain-containing protein n=1 Tax=Parachaetomium inaequale TaxID=2588326 RepID=A0AAN6P711_9PEZI|nr:hypothetical protein C8A01DRAFT_21238 [Parachaetomium inaequale]